MLPHIILVLLVVCNVGICVFCPFSFVFFRVSFSLLWAPYSAAYNNLIEFFPVISLYMPAQLRGSCGHLKGKYDSHLTCINCAGCSRYNSCVECLSWTDSIWTLAEKRRSFKGRGMGKKKESKGKQQKGFTSKRSSRTESLDDPAGSSVISLDDDSPSGEPAPVLSRSSSGGDLRLGDSSVPSQRSHGTTGSKADSGSLTTHRSTPSRSHPGDLDGKYGVQAPAKDFMATPFGPNPPPGDPTLSTLSQDRSSRSGSKYPVDRPSSDRSDRSTRKGSIGDRSHRSPSTGTTGHRSHRSPGTGNTGHQSPSSDDTGHRSHRSPGTGNTGHRSITPGAPVRPVKPGAKTTPGLPVFTVPTGTPVTPVITGHTGQKALESQETQFLDSSEPIVQNSPVRPVQLEHNDQDYSDLLNSDSHDDKADESPERAILRHARHQSPVIADTGHTGHFGTGHTGHIGTGHTGSTGSTGHTGQHRSKRQQSVHRTHSVRSDTDDHRSSLINRTLQQHRLDLEYRSAVDRSRHHSRSSRKDSGTQRATISLRHADPGELSPAEMLRHRRVRSRSRSYDSVSPRRHSRSPSRSRGKKKKSHKKRKHSSTSSSSRRRSSSSSRERSKHRHVYKKKKKHTKSHSSKRDKHVKKHKRKRSPSPSPSSSSSIVSSSCSSSSRQRSPARKRSRSRSRSSSSAEENFHVPAPRAASPSLLRDGISLCADDDDQFNSQSEEHQDLIPDTEIRSNASDIHSNMSSEDMRFQNLIEEVFKLLPADRFPRKTEGVLGGNKPRSSIEMELMKAPRKSISLPQSKGPLSKALDCIKQSMGSVEQKDGSFPMPPTVAQDWLPSKSDMNKLVKLKYYQSHEELIPTATASALDPDANRLDISLSGSYPVKVSSLQSLEGQSRDMIRILSHAEIFSFAAFKSLQSENMDSKVLLEILKSMSMAVTDAMSIATAQTLGLQQMRREAAIESAPKGSLTTEAKRKLRLTPLTSKLLFGGQVSDIYKENVTENQERLVKKAVNYQAKPNPPAGSSRKPKAKSGKNKPKTQETPKKDFPFVPPRPPRGRNTPRGSGFRGRGAGPSRRGASASGKH